MVLIRLIPTAAHTDEHISKTIDAFSSIKEFVMATANKLTA
jgi:hypothetical protein